MDRVRLGRALGFGARAAAKTLVQAADAAMSPNPNPSPPRPTPTAPPAAQTAASSRPHAANVVNASSRMGRSILEPVKRHSHEVWLQVTGSFFALLACSIAAGMWAQRIPLRLALQRIHSSHAALWSQDLLKFCLAAAACLMFAYFAFSNFMRAGRSSAAHKAEQRRR